MFPSYLPSVVKQQKGVSFDQWSYELQTLRKSYSGLVLREGIQHSLREAAADVVCNMGLNVPLDLILKKFTIM